MKFLLLLAFLGVALGASLPKTQTEEKHEVMKPTALEVRNAVTVTPKDWLTDLILQLLGITAAELLKLISTTFIGMEEFIKAAVATLEDVISAVDGDAAEKIREIINVALEEVLEIMEPFQEQLEQVLPAITRENTTMDIVSDIILALLGITLEELLTTVTTALGDLEIILGYSLEQLQKISEEVSPEVAAQIQKVNNDMLADTEVLLKPLINKLNQIFPQDSLHQIPQLASKLLNLKH